MTRLRTTVGTTVLLALVANSCSSNAYGRTYATAPKGTTAATEPTSPTRASPTGTSTTEFVTPSSLPLDTLVLPIPDGAAAVGVTNSGFPDTEVFYPALAGSGHGPHVYIRAMWATAASLDPAQLNRVRSYAQLDATPEPTTTARPVVVLMPGWRSLIAFSTSLAEELASHGYVVLAMQSDVATETSHPNSTPEDRASRAAALRRLLAFMRGPSLHTLVGPIDLRRVAVGGHSYAGSIAFDANLTDRRIAAVFDLDGSMRSVATRPSPTVPALVVVTVSDAVSSDPLLGPFVARSPNIVALGVLNALHMDLTDATVLPGILGTSVFAPLVGTIGAVGITDTSTIVLRFLDVALGANAHTPSSDELARGLPSVTNEPFPPIPPATQPTTQPTTQPSAPLLESTPVS